MKPWSHLPNASLIDWVIESLKCNPELWAAALNAALRAVRDVILNAAWDAALRAARDAAHNAAWYAAYKEARDAAYNAAWAEVLDNVRSEAWDTTRDVARVAACDAAHGAILALVAYDDCRQYLHMSYEQLLAWAHLSERPQAVLLLPLKWIQEHECLVTST